MDCFFQQLDLSLYLLQHNIHVFGKLWRIANIYFQARNGCRDEYSQNSSWFAKMIHILFKTKVLRKNYIRRDLALLYFESLQFFIVVYLWLCFYPVLVQCSGVTLSVPRIESCV